MEILMGYIINLILGVSDHGVRPPEVGNFMDNDDRPLKKKREVYEYILQARLHNILLMIW